MKRAKNIVRFITFPFIFGFGFVVFLFTKRTIKLPYAAFRYLFVLTNGRINDFHSKLVSIVSKPKSGETSSLLKQYSTEDVDRIVQSVERDGYFDFDAYLPEEDLMALVDYATKNPTRCIDVNQRGVAYLKDKILFDGANPVSPRYQFDTADIISHPVVRKVIFDAGFRNIAARYLRCQPILDIVTMWWSVPFAGKGASQAAQMFHFDMDRFKFIKFFFYLTDVHTDNGPHCYVRGSHLGLLNSLREDRRLTDDELKQHYPSGDFKEFVGRKGKILAVDTRGLHKGKPLVDGSRLLFQIQFSNSLYGAAYEKMPVKNLTGEETALVHKHQRTYQLLR